MKVLLAATEEQEKEIVDHVQYIFTWILPKFFTDEEIDQFQEWGVLKKDEKVPYFGTMKEAFQIITSLQVIRSILLTDEREWTEHHVEMFDKNTERLEEMGYSFPFFLSHFTKERQLEQSISQYAKAANELLL